MKASFSLYFRACLFVLAVAELQNHSAFALPVCASGGLDSYIALNSSGGCTVGAVTLFNFAFTASPPSNLPAPPSASDIIVTPLSNVASNGLSFASSLFTLSDNTQAQIATYLVSYSVDPPPIIVDEDLMLDPPFGSVVVTQNVCEFAFFSAGCEGGISLSHSVTPSAPTSSLVFPTPTSFVDIQNIFSLRSLPGSPAGFDSLDAQSVVTPEPSTAFFALVGVAILGAFVRRPVRRFSLF